MKLSSKLLLSGVLVIALGVCACNTKVPPTNAYSAPNTTPNYNLVANFDAPPGGSVSINPNLFEVGAPGNQVIHPGGVTLVNTFPASIPFALGTLISPGSDGTGFAFRTFANLNDPGNGSYPEVDVEARLESGNEYNMSFFTGVKFYLNVAGDDTAGKRIFEIPTYQTQAVQGGGGCDNSSGKCYDHFFVPYSSTNGKWALVSHAFTDFQRQGFGWPFVPGPQNLAGNNLTQVLWLMWAENNNNVQGNVIVDFSIDDVEFY